MTEWRPVAELCDTKPQSATGKKLIGDAGQAARSIYTSAERNISEFNDDLAKAKGNPQQLDADADAFQKLTPPQKLAQGACAFFDRVDKTVTRITLLRNPPLSKHFIYVCAVFLFLALLGVVGFSWNRHPPEEAVTLSALEGPYPVVGESVIDTVKRLGESNKRPEPRDNGLSEISVLCSGWQSGFTVSFSGETVVGFVYMPLEDSMSFRERQKVCSRAYAENVKERVVSAYKNTKGITEKDGKLFDRHDRLLNFVAFDNGSVYAYAMEYENKMGIIGWTETERSN